MHLVQRAQVPPTLRNLAQPCAVQSDITATYTAPFSWITGRVQESAGDVVPNAELDLSGDCFACSQTATSGADGRYAATLFQGVYDIEVTPPAPLPQQTLEDIDCTGIDVSLDVDY